MTYFLFIFKLDYSKYTDVEREFLIIFILILVKIKIFWLPIKFVIESNKSFEICLVFKETLLSSLFLLEKHINEFMIIAD